MNQLRFSVGLNGTQARPVADLPSAGTATDLSLRELNEALSPLVALAVILRPLVQPLLDRMQTVLYENPTELDVEDALITLDQIAAMVHRSKRTLQRCLTKMPDPRIPGGGGRPSMWAWSEVRPWLQEFYRTDLPERFPGRQMTRG